MGVAATHKKKYFYPMKDVFENNAYWVWGMCVMAGWVLAGYGIHASGIESTKLKAFWYLTLFLNIAGFIYFITFENL